MVYQPERERITLRSTIQADLLSVKVRRGSLLAGSGALMILLGGIFLPYALLKLFGIPLFFTGLSLIGLGLIPFKRLSRLQLKPHEIHYDGTTLTFLREGKPLLQIMERAIGKMEFVKREEEYGLGIWLKRPIEEKVKVLQPRFDFSAFVTKSSAFEGCDLFLPYFSEFSCKTLISTR